MTETEQFSTDDKQFFEKVSKELAKVRNAGNVKKKTREATEWYYNKVKATAPTIAQHAVMFKGRQAVSKMIPGSMMTFRYQSKLFDEGSLPYFDAAPLIIFLDIDSHENLLGLNVHYLPPVVRAKVMSFLIGNVRSKVVRHDNRLPINYQKVQAISKLKPLRFAIKSYIPNRAMGKVVRVQPEEWHHSIFLPVAKFVGSSPRRVWKENPYV